MNALSKAYQVTIRQIYRVLADEKGDTRGRARVSKPVSFRVPVGEIEAFLASARGVGITGSSQAFRALVRMALVFLSCFQTNWTTSIAWSG
ncbi:hypothetical protein FEE96_21655 [Parasedimentitalea maritima]|uniref:Integrase n=1 Tax=Parasedimentitalea maritima TaxID=2578117 RepID=A0ABY2UNP5_9RHOB|nr:hypothetical protein [Zongyanglinia marina]TLP55906.1 hypothetical protein FEE96_21655 [Zongyanglinia marina]